MNIAHGNNHKYSITKTILLVAALFLNIETAQAFSNDNNIDTTKYLSHQKDAALLVAAVEANKIKLIKALVDDGVDINIPLLGDGTALMIAVQNNNVAMMNELLLLNANPDGISPGDGSPLIIAAKRGDVKLAKVLIKHGSNVNIFAEGDETPLINASKNNYYEMVKFLVEHGADINFSVKESPFNGKYKTAVNQSKSHKVRQYLLQQIKRQKDLAKKHEQSNDSQKNQHYSAILADIKKRYGLPSISIAININGKVVWAEAQGYANIEKNILATIETQYAVGSIAKPMTSLAMARLIDQEKLDLYQSINHYGNYNLPLQQFPLTQK